MKLARIDTAWFRAQIAASRFGSQRQLAFRMRGRESPTMDPATLNRMLKGRQPMLPAELVQMATLLGLSMREVLKRYGFPV